MICVKYIIKVIGRIYYATGSDKNTVVGFSGFFVDIWLPKPTTVIFITRIISSIFTFDIDLFQLWVVTRIPCNTLNGSELYWRTSSTPVKRSFRSCGKKKTKTSQNFFSRQKLNHRLGFFLDSDTAGGSTL